MILTKKMDESPPSKVVGGFQGSWWAAPTEVPKQSENGSDWLILISRDGWHEWIYLCVQCIYKTTYYVYVRPYMYIYVWTSAFRRLWRNNEILIIRCAINSKTRSMGRRFHDLSLCINRRPLTLGHDKVPAIIPSRELTYPPKMAFWRLFSFSEGGIC